MKRELRRSATSPFYELLQLEVARSASALRTQHFRSRRRLSRKTRASATRSEEWYSVKREEMLARSPARSHLAVELLGRAWRRQMLTAHANRKTQPVAAAKLLRKSPAAAAMDAAVVRIAGRAALTYNNKHGRFRNWQ